MPRRIHRLLIILLIGGFLFFLSTLTHAESVVTCESSTAWSHLKINEVYPFGSSDWIEIYNPWSQCIDITDLEIHDSSTNKKLFFGILNAFDWTTTPFSNWLNNGGDSIILKSKDDTIFDLITYDGTHFAMATATQSIARVTDGADTDADSDWSLTISSTPGQANQITAYGSAPTDTTTPTSTTLDPLWAGLRLNEIMPDPESGDEWVEIYNPSASAVDLTGGYICDSRAETSTYACQDLSGTIGALDWLTWYTGTAYLNNTGDKVYLKNPLAEIVDSFDYNASLPGAGQSVARTTDGTGSWAITTDPTPSSTNIITAPSTPSSGGGADSPSESAISKSTTSSSTTKSTAKKSEPSNKDIIWKLNYPTRITIASATTFSASGSMDTRGGRLDIGWQINEKIFATGTVAQFAFTTSGPQTITVRATSTAGSVGYKTFKIRVLPTSTVAQDIVISAAMPNTDGDSEYIKLQNRGERDADISAWQIFYKNQTYAIPRSTTIRLGDELTFYQPITKFTLNNSGGEIELRDSEDFLVDVFEYGKTKTGIEVVENTDSTSTANTPASTPSKKSTYSQYLGNTTISAARAAPDDSYVKITGVVAVPPGILGSQFFYATDGDAGLQIYQYKKDFPPLSIGDRVTLDGVVGTASGVRRLRLKSARNIDILSTNSALMPVSTTISELTDENLGALVQVSGEITEIKSNYLYLDDGGGEITVYLKANAKIDKSQLKEGELVTVTGILDMAKNSPQIYPRAASDIVSLGPSADLSKKPTSGTGSETKNFITATVGGLTAFLVAFFVRSRGAIFLSLGKNLASIAGRFIKRG